MANQILFWIGVYLIIDGIVSFIFFQDTATQFQQLIRVIRAGIGLYLIIKNK